MIFLDILFQEQRDGDCSWDIYIAHTYTWHWLFSVILIMDIVNHSAGLIMSYHMFDAVIRGMVAPPDKVAYTNTN